MQAGRRGGAHGEQEQAGDHWDGRVIARLGGGGRRETLVGGFEAPVGSGPLAGSRGQRALYSETGTVMAGSTCWARAGVDAAVTPANSAKTSAAAIAR